MDADARRRAEDFAQRFHEEVDSLTERGRLLLASRVADAVAQAVSEAQAERDAEMLQELHVRDVAHPCPTHGYLHCGICAERDRQQLLVQHQALKRYEEEAVRRYDTAEGAVNRQMIEIAQQAEEIVQLRAALEYIRYNCQVRTKTAAVAKIVETLDDLGIATATPSPPIEPTPEAQGERA